MAQAHAFAYPPIATVTEAHAGTLAPDVALVRCDNPHLVLSAVTASKRRSAFVVRWYNSSPEPQRAEMTIPHAARVRAVNFLEAPVRRPLRRVGPQRWGVRLGPFEVMTLQVKTR